MTRKEKYPDTDTFHFYNANPKNRFTTDCTVRAICTATEIPYNTVVMEMAELQCKTGYDADENKLIDLYLQSKGWKKHPQPRKWNNTKYTGWQFCKEYRYPKVIANIGGHHIVAIIRGKVYDTWDSTSGCIGNYWVKAGEVL
jgi:hypothetical protein